MRRKEEGRGGTGKGRRKGEGEEGGRGGRGRGRRNGEGEEEGGGRGRGTGRKGVGIKYIIIASSVVVQSSIALFKFYFNISSNSTRRKANPRSRM